MITRFLLQGMTRNIRLFVALVLATLVRDAQLTAQLEASGLINLFPLTP